jgi:hypothetical protein
MCEGKAVAHTSPPGQLPSDTPKNELLVPHQAAIVTGWRDGSLGEARGIEPGPGAPDTPSLHRGGNGHDLLLDRGAQVFGEHVGLFEAFPRSRGALCRLDRDLPERACRDSRRVGKTSHLVGRDFGEAAAKRGNPTSLPAFYQAQSAMVPGPLKAALKCYRPFAQVPVSLILPLPQSSL